MEESVDALRFIVICCDFVRYVMNEDVVFRLACSQDFIIQV